MHGNQIFSSNDGMFLADYGPEPFAANLRRATLQNDAFRMALWTGDHLQLTLMRIKRAAKLDWKATRSWTSSSGLKEDADW